MTTILARAKLRRDVPAASFAAALAPADPNRAASTSHNLLWSLYSDDANRKRDFLWRQTRRGEWLLLGSRAPVDQHGLFEIEHKPFAPTLQAGQRLGFTLRVNPTVSRTTAGGERGQRCDVVMDALYALPREQRPAQRAQLTNEAVAGWLQRQGDRTGFDLVPDTLCVESYQQVRVPRAHGQSAQFSIVDCTGMLTVRDPETFVPALSVGFGRARAFGCGMMLIHRVH
jgi:CRISPR system Cascade subunit CasE